MLTLPKRLRTPETLRNARRHEAETAVTNLAATVYWGELYLTRSTPAATATSDCQSGPSTVFRLAALPAILIPWYLQTILGKRMVRQKALVMMCAEGS